MSSLPKANITGIGLLSNFALMQYFGEGGIEVLAVPEKDRIVDIQEGLEIGPNLRLRTASKEDAQLLSTYPTGNRSVIQPSIGRYVLECSINFTDTPIEHSDATRQIRHTIRSAITALRLLKSSYVESNIIIMVTTRGTKKDHSLLMEETLPLHYGNDYRLRTDELPELKKLITRTLKIGFFDRTPRGIALDRFNKSCEELKDEDKLIDCMISLEALFLKGETGREKGKRISNECASLLGKTQEDRLKIKSLLDCAYKTRNCIVHGSDYQSALAKNPEFADDPFALEKLINNVQNILRASLRKLI